MFVVFCAQDARKMYNMPVPPEFKCTGSDNFNPQFPQVQPSEVSICILGHVPIDVMHSCP